MEVFRSAVAPKGTLKPPTWPFMKSVQNVKNVFRFCTFQPVVQGQTTGHLETRYKSSMLSLLPWARRKRAICAAPRDDRPKTKRRRRQKLESSESEESESSESSESEVTFTTSTKKNGSPLLMCCLAGLAGLAGCVGLLALWLVERVCGFMLAVLPA